MAAGDDLSCVEVALPQDLTAASRARSATRTVLGRWRLGALVEPVLLTVSELVGNAVRHGRPPVALWLRRHGSGVRIDVHDEAAEEPALRDSAPNAEGGRGLVLVEAVASETGVHQIEGDGKTVWATIDARSAGC